MTNLSTTSKNIMTALLTGALLSKEVADSLGVKTTVVTGSLAGLKKNGFVEVTDSKLSLTEAGRKLVAPVVEVVSTTLSHKGDKKVAAARIIGTMPGASRKDIIARFVADLGMSGAQASTYHYNLTGKNGMWNKS